MAEREPSSRDMHMAMMLEELEGDAKTRGRLHEIIAEKYPDHASSIPDVAVRNAVAPILADLNKTKAELDAERARQTRDRNIEALNAALLAAGAKKDEIPELHAYMHKHQTLDPNLAVMGYRKEHEVAAPAPRVGGGWGVTLPGDKRSGKFFEGVNGGPGITDDWRGWRRDRANQDLADMAAGRELQPMDA